MRHPRLSPLLNEVLSLNAQEYNISGRSHVTVNSSMKS